MARWKKEQQRKDRIRQYQLAKLSPEQRAKLTRQTAFHEAGHVVFGALRGPGVEIVTIDPERVRELTGHTFPGYTRYKDSGPGPADDILGLTIAGLTSEAMFVTGGVVNSQEDDLGRLNDLLEDQLNLHGDAKAREMVRIRLLVEQFTTENRVTIEAVANALIERKTLTEAEIHQILKP